MNPWKIAGAGALGAASGFMQPNQKDAYNQYASDIRGIADQYNPYTKVGKGGLYCYAGLSALNTLAPAHVENRLASSFTNSPYQQQIMQNTTNQMNANAAQTGMLGSTAQQSALQDSLASQQNQWQQQYINRGENQYNQGMQGMYNLAGMGLQGLGSQSRLEQESALGSLKANLAPNEWQSAFTGAAGAMGGLL